MRKLLLVCIISFFSLSFSVKAGEFESAYNSGSPVFLYIYTNNCNFCKKFESRYRGLVRSHSAYKFVKVNAETEYGRKLMLTFNGGYVPYIVLSSKTLKKSAVVSPMCIMNDICTEKALKDFKKG